MKTILPILVFILCSCSSQKIEFSGPEKYLLLKQGMQQFERNEYDDAAASFETAYELGAGAIALDALGCIALKNNYINEAEILFTRAIGESNGSHEDSIPDTLENQDYISIGSIQSIAYMHLAYVKELKSDQTAALVNYQKALSLEPKNYLARNNLAAALFDQQKMVNLQKAILLGKKELRKGLVLIKDPIINENLKRLNELGRKYEN